MKKFLTRMNTFVADNRGVTAIEYGMILALLSMVIVVAVQTTGVKLLAIFQRVVDILN